MESNKKDEEQKIVVITDGEANAKPWSVSWASYWHYVKKFKYWILCATVLMGLIGYAALEYVYNPKKETFKIGFAYKKSDFITKTDSSGNISYYYPNGDQLDYQSIISHDSMKTVIELSKKSNQAEYKKNNPEATDEQVKNIKGDYDSIDYEKISSNNLLTISPITDSSIINTTDYLGYNISGFTYDFPSKTLLQDFIIALANYGRTALLSGDFRPTADLDGFNSTSNPYSKFENQMAMLTNEVDFLFSSYTSLESIYGKNALISSTGTTTINNAFNTFKAKIGLNSEDTDTSLSDIYSLSNSLSYSKTVADVTTTYTYVYVDSSTSKQSYISYFKQKDTSLETRLTEVKKNYSEEEQNYNEISEQLKDTTLSSEEKNILRNALSTSYSILAKYRTEQSNYEKQIETVESQINFVNSVSDEDWSNWNDSNETLAETDVYKNYKEIVSEITNQYNLLTQEANTLKTIYDSISESYSSTTSNNVTSIYRYVMTTSGSLSWYLGAGAGVVLGYVISSCVALAFGQSERRRKILLGEKDPILPVKEEVIEEAAQAPTKQKEEPVEEKTTEEKKEEQEEAPKVEETSTEEEPKKKASSAKKKKEDQTAE